MRDHLDKMEEKAKVIRDELFKKMGKENALDYLYELELEEKPEWFQYSAMGMELRARIGKDEAYEIIKLLKQPSNIQQENKKFTLEWSYIKTVKSKKVLKTVTKEMTRPEMINRLEAITYEDYGDDLKKWDAWVAFREENGFWRTR
jgi:hypothetical protein